MNEKSDYEQNRFPLESAPAAVRYSVAEALGSHDFEIDVKPGTAIKEQEGERSSDNGLNTAGFWSTLLLSWLTPLISKAYKSGLKAVDVWSCSEDELSQTNYERLNKLWTEEVEARGRQEASIGRAFFKFVKKRLLLATLFLTFGLLVQFFSAAFIVRYLLEFTESTSTDIGYGIGLVVAMFFAEIFRSLNIVRCFYLGIRTGTRIRNAALTLIFKKVLALRSLQDKTVGEIVNLCTNDGQRIFEAALYTNFLLVGPPLMLAGVVYTTILIGPTALLGSTIYLLFWPLMMVIGRLTMRFRAGAVGITDGRVRLMNEIITCVKLIKMYAWELSFAHTISDIREEERAFLEKAGYVQSLSLGMTPLVTVMATVLTLTTHTLTGNDITASEAFTVVTVFGAMRFTILSTPFAVKALGELRVAINRFDSVLLMEELEPITEKPENKSDAVVIRDASFTWESLSQAGREAEGAEKTNEESKMTGDAAHQGQAPVNQLTDINLTIKKGALIGVCGGVGSGKTSLASAIMNMMNLRRGSIAVDGNMAYAAQQAWIINDTLRENILFEQRFNGKRYNKALFACNLLPDIKQLPDGDKTEIGERGLNVSGGQRQRVSLARAYYSDQDIYILDDPLSAVDAHVGQHIFQHLIKGALKDKTVLFITHQLQYLSECDEVLMLKNGRVVEQGSHDQLLENDGEYARLIKVFYSGSEEELVDDEVLLEQFPGLERQLSVASQAAARRSRPQSLVRQHSQQSMVAEAEAQSLDRQHSLRRFHRQRSTQLSIASSSTTGNFPDVPPEPEEYDGRLTKAEEMAETVHLSTYWSYFKLCGGVSVSVFTLLLFLLIAAISTFSNLWLSIWLNQPVSVNTTDGDGDWYISSSVTDNPDLEFYTLIYGLTILFMVVALLLKTYVFVKVTLHASTGMHGLLFDKVFASPMSFFDTTPSGRILNRFSKDMDEVDVRLPFSLDSMLNMFFTLLFSVAVVCAVFPWFLIALPFLLALFVTCYRYYHNGIRDLKQLENVSRSPWFSHITASVQGIPSIHAYRREEQTLKKFRELLDDNSMLFQLFNMASQWVALRLDIITIVTTTTTALMIVLTKSFGSISPAMAGLALSYATQMAGYLQNMVRMMAEAEARFTSVERINFYIKSLESEAPPVVESNRPAAGWPGEGSIRFDNFKLRYRSHLPLVLKGINCRIAGREKIGIVGRTGSGKSTLGVALFRLVEAAEGSITVDGVDISGVGLHDLRSRLAIIPQDPVLFARTIRYNLDPFDNYQDQQLWDALDKCFMKELVSILPEQLGATVVENGENFSVGERQLLCMARALLRDSKILMMDEATAAIDTETDSLIQTTIRESFSHCTVLTIAHRLNTVLSSDRIMVMNQGLVHLAQPRPSLGPVKALAQALAQSGPVWAWPAALSAHTDHQNSILKVLPTITTTHHLSLHDMFQIPIINRYKRLILTMLPFVFR